ncbi:MAG TPA: hypothetical protein VJA94_22855, partial [Candidatus Angelobacter sp.]
MKKLLLSVLLLAAAPMGIMTAQQSPAGAGTRPNFVFDDDGGAVQIVPAGLASASAKEFHGGAMLPSVQQVSIFLGGGWGSAGIRSREIVLSDLAASDPAGFAELSTHNVAIQRAAPLQEDFSDLSKTSLNDLSIQHKLAEMLQSKAIPAPQASTVYVIFLAPGVNSSLGGHKPGTDYAAYHNFFHLQAGEIHYVVVPFAQSGDVQRGAAAHALV